MSQELIDKLKRFQLAYSQTPLQLSHFTGYVGATGHGFLVKWPEDVDRITAYHRSRAVLQAAGYTKTEDGWLPTSLVLRRELDDMCSQVADYVARLADIGSTLPLAGQRQTLEAQTKLAAAVASINSAQAYIK